jgi:hypothetical protein
MAECKTYYFYSKNDIKKEAIDKTITFCYNDALYYFANRKQMDIPLFISLYNIETI